MPPEVAFLRERPREDPLEPTGSLEPLDRGVVQDVIGPQGTLSEVIAGFERRRQQEQMADAVAEAINDQRPAPGRGGYRHRQEPGLPGAGSPLGDRARRDRRPSTNTLALQDQLLRKDVPDLIAALAKADSDRQVGVVALKGRANYSACENGFPGSDSSHSNRTRLGSRPRSWRGCRERRLGTAPSCG